MELKNKIWVGITTPERVSELLSHKHILIRPKYCLCVDTVQPNGMVEATTEIVEAFDITDRQWLLGTSRKIYEEQAEQNPEAVSALSEELNSFFERFEEELRKEESENGREDTGD